MGEADLVWWHQREKLVGIDDLVQGWDVTASLLHDAEFGVLGETVLCVENYLVDFCRYVRLHLRRMQRRSG
jgi:hypothetical protein